MPTKTDKEEKLMTVTLWGEDAARIDVLAQSIENKGYRVERRTTFSKQPFATVDGKMFSGYREIMIVLGSH
ncbi:MAG: hypothetical protein AAB458_03120 [Patescibacteria group bacterium]